MKKVNLSDIELSQSEQEFLDKVISVGEFFVPNKKDNTLDISLTKKELINDYNFSEEDYKKLNDNVLNYKLPQASKRTVTPQFHVENGALYISHTDLVGGAFGLVAAAQAGPYALQAALIALGSATSGPVGTVVTTILGILSVPSLTTLSGMIIWALGSGQGVYIKPVFSYPPLELGYW
ncbi:hypothetical protein [Sediminibacillus sp. JSM 1682029]